MPTAGMPHFMRSSCGPLNAGRALLVGLLALAAANPAPADAGTYQQFDCRRPDGTWAPADGWSGAGSSCPRASEPWELRVDLTPPDSSLTWSEANDDLSLLGFTLRRSVSLASAVYRLESPAGDPRDVCLNACETAQTVRVDGLDGGEISAVLECRALVCHGSAAIEAATITLLDSGVPRVGEVGGALLSGRPIWGIADLTYRAFDDGSGIYRHRLIVDGATVVQEVPDSDGDRCRDALPGSGSDYEFDYTEPCPKAVTGRIAYDLNRLSAGPHQIEAVIEDASGNKRSLFRGPIDVVSDPAARRVDLEGVAGLTNPLGDRPGHVANGSGASRTAGLTALFERPGGRRALAVATTFPRMPAIQGRLVGAGGPIAAATVSLLQRVSGDARWEAVATGRTAADGTVRFRVPSGPSRALRLAYFADSEATHFIASVPLTLRVRPSVSLRARRTGQRVRFYGAVRSGSIPAAGLVVTLEAGSRWTVRTGRDGRFTTSRRFRRSTVRVRCRAVVERQADHPYARGTSAPVWVRLQRGADRRSRRGEFR